MHTVKAAAAIAMALAAAGCGSAAKICIGGTAAGNVVIRSDSQLQQMVGCMHVKGNLTIMSSTVTRVDELESLTTVDGSVVIRNNNTLADVSGLANLTSVGVGHLTGPSGLTIEGNPMLTEAAFRALIFLNGQLEIGGAGLTDVSFPALTSIDGGLSVVSTTSQTTLAGLAGVITIGGNLMIQGNAALTDTAGLSGLAAVPTDVLVSENPALTKLSLPSLASVGAGEPSPTAIGPSSRHLYVATNPALTGVSLPMLSFVGTGGVRFVNNPMLPQCQADAVAAAAGQTCNCTGNTGTAACN
jgi:hypothetical protein